MDIFSLAGTAIICAALCVIVRQYRPEAAIGVSVAGGIILLCAAALMLSPCVQALKELSARAGLDESYVGVLLKALAVCCITQLAADICRDAGESALAARLEMAGRAAVAVISLPVFMSLADIVAALVEGTS